RKIAADHVVKRLVAGMTLDVLEQERGRFAAADEVGDGRSFEIGIDFRGDALELAQCVDLFQPGVEIAGIGGAGPDRSRLRGLSVLARTDRDAHVHGAAPACNCAVIVARMKRSAIRGQSLGQVVRSNSSAAAARIAAQSPGNASAMSSQRNTSGPPLT